jgi:hypothetical protein
MNWVILVIVLVIVIAYQLFIRSYPVKTYRFVQHPDITSDVQREFEEISRNIIASSGWNDKHNIREDAVNGDIRIILTPRDKLSSRTLEQQYDVDGRPIRFSITTQSIVHKPVIEIDATNWKEGVERSKLTLDEYRQYVITHEFGHALGYDHQKCEPGIDAQCPVMYQATRGCGDRKCGTVVKSEDYNDLIPQRYYRY